MNEEVKQAVAEALAQEKAAAEALKIAKAGDVTGGTYIWAIVAALLSPLVAVIIGIVYFVKGQSSKGKVYVIMAVLGFILSAIIMSMQ